MFILIPLIGRTVWRLIRRRRNGAQAPVHAVVTEDE